MLCGRCANPVPAGSSFCLNCGADLPDPSSSPPASLDEAGVAKLTRMLREETAGEYEIEREIARGGMGVVYLATEIQLRRRVAIKVLPPTLTFGSLAIERFRREARTAAALDHPNIIPIYRVSSGGELLWYSMKLLAGRSLESVLKERGDAGLELDETMAILAQVAEALDYAHQRGVVHRDVKPGNIVLDDRARVTVTDFGIAKEVQEASLSGSGHLLGSPYYMAPEQYVGGEIQGAADQYALGVVAFQCLSGRVPFDGATAYELLNKHVGEPPPSLAELRPGLPSHVYAAIERALAKRADERFPSVTAFVTALAGRLDELVRVPRPPRPPRRRATLLWWAAGTGTAAAMLYGGVALWRADREADASPVTRAAPAATLGASPPPPPPPAPPAPPAPARPVQAPTALLVIRLADGWARIYVDGALRGERPVHREELPPGTHTLRFERPGFVPVDTTVTLRAGRNLLDIALQRQP